MIILENKPDVPNEVLDEEKAAAIANKNNIPIRYQWLKIVNLLFWLFLLSFIGWISYHGFLGSLGNSCWGFPGEDCS